MPEVAEKIPGDAGGYEDPDTKPESLVKRFYRWLKNEEVSPETYFFPFAKRIVKALARETLVLVIDGTVVGRGCMALVIGVVYKGRALPIAWLVEKKKKGHFTEERHIELIKSVKEIIPDGSRVVLLGDGEFDGVDLQSIVNNWRWEYVLRTAEPTTMCWKAERRTGSDQANAERGRTNAERAERSRTGSDQAKGATDAGLGQE